MKKMQKMFIAMILLAPFQANSMDNTSVDKLAADKKTYQNRSNVTGIVSGVSLLALGASFLVKNNDPKVRVAQYGLAATAVTTGAYAYRCSCQARKIDAQMTVTSNGGSDLV